MTEWEEGRMQNREQKKIGKKKKKEYEKTRKGVEKR